MNNYTLHKLPKEGFIITSDEEIKAGKWCYSVEYNCLWQRSLSFDRKEDDNVFRSKFPSYLLIAHSNHKHLSKKPQIDFSSLTEEEWKKIGWFNSEEIYPRGSVGSNAYNFNGLRQEGFKKAQELLSNRVFTLEDVELFAAELIGRYRLGEINDVDDVQKIIASHSQSKSWKVELEINDWFKNNYDGTIIQTSPKYNNGKVKIIRIL